MASSGETGAPCGDPCSLAVLVPSSMTPAASHLAISRRTLSSAIRCGSNLFSQPRPRCRTTTRLTTGIEDLAEAIRAWAKGWLPTEAAAELLIGHRGWLLREDFLQVAVEVRWEPFRGREVAAVDFAAAADAVQGVLPCSDGERQVLLVAASIAEGIPVDLREAALCMDAANAARAAQAVCHAAGRRVTVVAEAGR